LLAFFSCICKPYQTVGTYIYWCSSFSGLAVPSSSISCSIWWLVNSASNDQGLLNREACTLSSQDIVLFVSFCLMKTATEAKKVKRAVAVFPVL
jgi:hypothetical protein